MHTRLLMVVSIAIAFSLVLVSCTAYQPPRVPLIEAPGFWMGVWHGIIAPITFIVSLFNEHVRIYAFPNDGRWYDLGFMLGIGGFSGGIFAGARGRQRK